MKQKSPSLPRKLALRTFARLLIVFSINVNLLYFHYSKNPNLENLGISSPIFLSRTNLKLHDISVIPMMTKKVITDLDLMVCGSDCIPLVFLKNYKPKFSYILAELFNMSLKDSCFPGC